MGVDRLIEGRAGGMAALGLGVTVDLDRWEATRDCRAINQHPNPHKPTKLTSHPAPTGLVVGICTGGLAETLKDAVESTDTGGGRDAIWGPGLGKVTDGSGLVSMSWW